MASATEAPDWGALPFSAVALIVAHASRLQRHQAAAVLSALRLVNRHWHSTVDDAVRTWSTPSRRLLPQQHLAAVLRRWRHLEQLSLVACELGQAALQALSHCRRLQRLAIAHLEQPRSDGAAGQLWEAVAALPLLQSLSVHALDEGPSPAGLAALAGCTSLTALELNDFYREDVAADVVAVLRDATAIQRLALFRAVRGTAAQAQQAFDIGFATQLTSLQLRASFTHDDAFLHLFSALTNLRWLDISGNRNLTDDGFLGITCLARSLTALVMEGGHEVTEDGATALAALTRLQSLSLGFSNHMSSDSLLPLVAGTLTQLTHLDIQGCHRACSPAAFGSLSRLIGLRRLVAKGCRLQQSVLATLAHLTNLQVLHIADNTALLALDPLTILRACTDLDVSDCGLEDAHLVPLLASLPQLRSVNVSENWNASEAVLEALAAGPARTTLTGLEASTLQVEWESVLKLLPQFPALQEIDLSGSPGEVDPAALLLAAEAAPSLHSVRVHEVLVSSANGWHEVRHLPGRRRLLRFLPWDVHMQGQPGAYDDS